LLPAPDGSYVGVHATTSADRSNSGISATVACACTRSRSATPNRFGETAKPAGFAVGLLVATLGFADDHEFGSGN
jgi:hypothetical protein